MEISEIFEGQIKIESKVISIDSLFNNEERVANTNYKPDYQRNYVWDDEKATYFIESILLGTEIPPLIYFRSNNKVEIIDGRQRYETVLRFIKDKFKLKKNGLQQLENIGIANKTFSGLDPKLIEAFEDTKLRIIEFSFHSRNSVNQENEDVLKREIFKRYNSGITPLKSVEIDKAFYLFDDLNAYLKSKLKGNSVLFRTVSSVLHFEKTSEEVLLKKVRQILVQHHIPIKYYAVKKDTVISRYYEHLFSKISSDEVGRQFNGFIEKINILVRVKEAVERRNQQYNRLMSECLFWGFSILEAELSGMEGERIPLATLISRSTVEDIADYLIKELSAFSIERSSFYAKLYNRYEVTSRFFSEAFEVDFELYLNTSAEFLGTNRELSSSRGNVLEFEDLRINKADSQSIAIVDICRQMERQRFLIRPAYQRNEVIDKKKSSSIIESILLGIKLPPIFIFKRDDQVSEVLDGQQRLLSILGFMGKSYLDEHNAVKKSNKDSYALNLKKGILTDLNGKTFEDLSDEQQEKIQNFDLWIIEINQRRNPDFDPIDLFIRLNTKPYPIKEDTFEMWNSYISRDIIETIKMIHGNIKEWFYFRKNNSRMEDENILTSLIYFEFGLDKKGRDPNYVSKDLDAYKSGNKINFRVRSKNEISRVLEDETCKLDFIKAANDFEFSFVRKLKKLLSDNDDSTATLNQNLNDIFSFDYGKRTQQSFYALWCLIYDIPYDAVVNEKNAIREDLRELFSDMFSIESKVDFETKVDLFKEKYKSLSEDGDLERLQRTDVWGDIKSNSYARLGDVAVTTSFKAPGSSGISLGKTVVKFFKTVKLDNLKVVDGESSPVTVDIDDVMFYARPKILVKRLHPGFGRLSTAYSEPRSFYNTDVVSLVPVRKGFHPKYVFGIVASKLAGYWCKHHASSISDITSISSSVIKQLPLPVTTVTEQEVIVKLVDILLSLEGRDEQFLYFERLLDAVVFELFLKQTFQRSRTSILAHLIPSLGVSSVTDATTTREYYLQLSSPDSNLSAELLRLLTIPEIAAIEKDLDVSTSHQ